MSDRSCIGERLSMFYDSEIGFMSQEVHLVPVHVNIDVCSSNYVNCWYDEHYRNSNDIVSCIIKLA